VAAYPFAQERAATIARFLASISAQELARATPERAYVAFPCFAREVADDMDATWASFHVRRLNHGHLEREPQAAVRSIQYPRPSNKSKNTKRPVPYQLVDKNPITRGSRTSASTRTWSSRF
jgi:hypothetical protein